MGSFAYGVVIVVPWMTLLGNVVILILILGTTDGLWGTMDGPMGYHGWPYGVPRMVLWGTMDGPMGYHGWPYGVPWMALWGTMDGLYHTILRV